MLAVVMMEYVSSFRFFFFFVSGIQKQFLRECFVRSSAFFCKNSFCVLVVLKTFQEIKHTDVQFTFLFSVAFDWLGLNFTVTVFNNVCLDY